jgi:hypothetical protein
MLRPDEVEKVRQLLAGQVSIRAIARKLRLSRDTVQAIAHGRRHDPPRPLDEEELKCLGPPVRCAKCGGMVYPPCSLCRIRAIKARQIFLAKMRRADARRAAG